MDGAKLKNFILIVLLLVNAFLLALMLYDRAEESGIRRQARADLDAAFASSGVQLRAELPGTDGPGVFTLRRDTDAEYHMVKAVLGACDVQDLGGNILFYSSARGEARFRGTGEFQIMPASGVAPVDGTPLDTALGILRDMGLTADGESAVVEESGQAITVTVTCRFRTQNVYNCSVSFLFTAENLLLIDGRRPLEQLTQTDAEELDTTTVLMRFLSEIRSSGLVCSEVRAVERGYVMSASAAGEGSMTPIWRIVTDVGVHYINGLTGKSESLT